MGGQQKSPGRALLAFSCKGWTVRGSRAAAPRDSLRALRALAGCAGKRSRVSSAPPPEQGSNPWSGNKKARGARSGLFLVKGGPSGVRTLGLGIKSPLLCQLS